MINLRRVMASRRLNAQEFQVFRSKGAFVKGGWKEISQDPPSFPMKGVVAPATDKELKKVPEADRVEGSMMFWSSEELYVTRIGENQGTSDVIVWKGERYRIIKIGQYSDYGFWSAMGVRESGV